jgi:hypothetical protein
VDIKQINSAIMFNTWTDAELTSIVSAIRFARANLQHQNIRSISLGSTVRWHSQKRGVHAQGRVEKIARKYVTVRDQTNLLWRVPANMLEVV